MSSFLQPFGRSPPGSPACGILQVRILEQVVHALLQGIFPTQESNPSLLRSPAFLQVSSLPVGFLHSSVGKESTCNEGDRGSIPGSGRSPGEGIGYLLQYSWASLVAQLVKNVPAMWETWVWSQGWEDSPGEGKGYPLQYSGLENSMDCMVHGITKSWTQLSDLQFRFHFHFLCHYCHLGSPRHWLALISKASHFLSLNLSFFFFFSIYFH